MQYLNFTILGTKVVFDNSDNGLFRLKNRSWISKLKKAISKYVHDNPILIFKCDTKIKQYEIKSNQISLKQY
jgi:hypothetical protein